MKTMFVAALCLTTASAFAAEANFTVSLSASPATQVALGTPVTLTATVYAKPLLSIKMNNYRYTFSAAPAGGAAVAIATNVQTKSVTWNPPNAGTYELSVRVAEFEGRIPPLELRTLPYATATLPNYSVFTTGADLIPYVTPSLGSCAITATHPCTECPMVTYPIYVKNTGNVTVSSQITVTVKYQSSTIATWTTTAPAWGQQVKVGSYTTFPWNCPPITSAGNAPNYFITVDTTNAVHESNEQNNTLSFYLRFPERTSFQSQ